jgi:Tfp pilus assembly major pilin PilA
MKRNQQGITLISFILILAVVGFFGYILMRLFPVYTEYYSAVNDIKAVTQTEGVEKESMERIRDHLYRRFQISYVESIDLEKNVKMFKDKDGKSLQLQYEVRRPLMYNLDFVAKFDRKFPLNQRESVE